jgi:chromosomal replication initiation ATPase DnaA
MPEFYESFGRRGQEMVTKEQVLSAACDVMGESRSTLLGRARDKRVSRVRHMIMYLIRDLCGTSTVFIGLFLNREHTSVTNGQQRADYLLEHDETFRESHRMILSRLADMQRQQVAA